MILCAALAFAQQGLVDAKQQGLVGERPDGLVALVADGASQAIRELVDEVNAERMEEYRQIASDTDAPIEAVQARAGRQIIERLTTGQYFMDAGGRWRQK
jgi:uncharacterized protein YdbL (DUF1318 family)